MWSWSNTERAVRIAIVVGAAIREFVFADSTEPYRLLFILAGLGTPEALRLLGRGEERP